MKKLIPLILVAAVLPGCKKDKSSASIVGKWWMTSNSVVEYVNGNVYYQEKTPYDHDGYILFSSDGTGDQDIVQSTTSKPDGNAVLDIAEVFTYTYSGNSLVLNIPAQVVGSEQVAAGTFNATITTHTSTTLEYNITQQGEDEDGNTIKIVQVQSFTRD
jgi:hypothetical protein